MRQIPTVPDTLLRIRDLAVAFGGDSGRQRALDGVSFDIGRGETLCLVGESGCGKTVTAKTILRVLGQNAFIESGIIDYRRTDGSRLDLAALPERDRRLRSIRGNEISMIYQEPMSAMSSMYTVGNQISEVLIRHRRCSRAEARRAAVAAMGSVGIPEPGAALRRLYLRAVGRPAAAGHDRPGAGVRAASARPRMNRPRLWTSPRRP